MRQRKSPESSPPPACGGVGVGGRAMNDKIDRSDARTPRARRLRREATPAERRLWTQLRQREINNVHFRRQAPICPYFVDFACHRTRVVVEFDGGKHGFDAEALRDDKRTRFLEKSGFRVLRFWNHEVLRNLESVVDTICAALYQTVERAAKKWNPVFRVKRALNFWNRSRHLHLGAAAQMQHDREPPTPSPSPPQAGGGE